MEFSVNFWPVIITAVLLMPLGALYYSEKMMVKEWLKAIGKTMDEIQNQDSNMPLLMGGTLVSAIATTYLIAVLIASIGIATFASLALLLLVVYLIIFFIRLKNSLFDGNLQLFKVNLLGTFLEFIVTLIVFVIFL